MAGSSIYRRDEWEGLKREVARIEQLSESDRTPNEQAKVKLLKDRNWQEYIEHRYDYQDDWEYDEEN